MRFSILQLLIVVLIAAVLVCFIYPPLKFFLCDDVNFHYDRQQTIEYINATTSGALQEKLLDTINRISLSDQDKILVVTASRGIDFVHVDLISTTRRQVSWIEFKTFDGETHSTKTNQLESSGTYYFHGDISVPKQIANSSLIQSVRFRQGHTQSNKYLITDIE